MTYYQGVRGGLAASAAVVVFAGGLWGDCAPAQAADLNQFNKLRQRLLSGFADFELTPRGRKGEL